MPTNRLAHEKSPYLLQHAHNPVDWYPWGPEAFDKARSEDKPVFLSVGYSTCHWCHVMERESFESAEIAAVLNRHFVPVKVDREERPDVDRIYMTFVQATTQSGGWPMSVWLTPDLRPFFGGTYFPPDNRYGRPGFRVVLERLAEAWREDRPRVEQSAASVLDELQKYVGGRGGGGEVDLSAADQCFQVFRRSFDSSLGGFGQAPKFPRPVAYHFLFRYAAWKQNDEAREMALTTLRAMAAGGMNDQLGGGFHRYSVDEYWFVPHFEKMLYDQGQLAISYLEAYQLTGDEQYAREARNIFTYVLRDMTHPDGGFYSAEDADSVIDPAHPHEKGEGAFYVWSAAELRTILGDALAAQVMFLYGAQENGNVRNDPHEEFTGRNILYRAATVEQAASRFGVPVEEMERALTEARAKLLAARSTRVRPHLDDKILTAWNSLMISAFALGARVLGDEAYLQAARRASSFVRTHLYDPATGTLLRRWREGDAAIPGFLDDYALYATALLDLYEAGFDPTDLDLAVSLGDQVRRRFEDLEHGGFFSTEGEDEALVLRLKDDYDAAEPSGNSVAISLLTRLARFTDRDDLRQAAERGLQAFAPTLQQAAHTVPQMVAALLAARVPGQEVVLAGEPGATGEHAMLARLGRTFHGNRIVLRVAEATRASLARHLPMLAQLPSASGVMTAYVCRHYACQLPTSDPEQFGQLLA